MTSNRLKNGSAIIWSALRAIIYYIKTLLQVFIAVLCLYFYIKFYRLHEEINMPTEVFLASSYFYDILSISFILTFFLFGYRILTRKKITSDIDLKSKYSLLLDEAKRFNAEESLNFLRTLRKFDFCIVFNHAYNSDAQLTISLLKVVLTLHGVDITKFTDYDFFEIGKFLSPQCCEDVIHIDKEKLHILDDMLPLMEILKREIERNSNETLNGSSSIVATTLQEVIPSMCRTILLQKEAIEKFIDKGTDLYIERVEDGSKNLIKLMNLLLIELNFGPDVYKNWHEIKDLQSIATSESMSVKKFYS